MDNLFRAIEWTESGGPPVRAPSHRSFGLRLIEHSFVNQLHGRANLDFAVSGVVCTLDIPLALLKAAPVNLTPADRVPKQD
jgi:two-component sensor histidine kinase